MVKAVRRLAGGPNASNGKNTCPDFLELEDGNFLFVGTDVTNETKKTSPLGVKCAAYERAIIVPRSVVMSGKNLL